MSSVAVSKRMISVEEYSVMGETGVLKPDERVELINGEILQMCPIGSKHAAVVANLTTILIQMFEREVIDWNQNPIQIDQWNMPEPDLAVLRVSDDSYTSAHPKSEDVLADIEVSDTTYLFDSRQKQAVYASAGIPVYWIINLQDNLIKEYTNPRNNQFSARTIYYPGDKISLLDESFDVTEILI